VPLIQSAKRAAIGQNIKTEEAAGKPHKQAVAIALNTARKNGANIPRKKGGKFAPKSHVKRHPAARHY